MPYKEKEINKLYYSIGEVATMFDVNTSLIRFWEKEFTAIRPKKNKKGNRLFTKKDIENIRTIYKLVREDGFTLEGAKHQLKGQDKPINKSIANQEIIEKLERIKKNILQLKL